MTSAWQEWKTKNLSRQEEGFVTPIALFNPNTPRVLEEVKKTRLAICEECPHYLISKQCSKCGCFMPTKTGLLHATCPIKKW